VKIFIDTANIKEIREAASMGVLDGVTTNPTILSREKGDYRDILKEICSIVKGPISAEVVSNDPPGMLREAKELAKIASNITIKVPITTEGLKAVKLIRAEGIMTNVTLVFSSPQALLAAKAGTNFVSPFIGRIDDTGHQGMNLVREIVTIFRNYQFSTEVIVASIRHPLHVVEAALVGAHIATIPFKVIEKLVKHPLTDVGMEKFLADWEKVKKQSRR